jgi:hypothetical protein
VSVQIQLAKSTTVVGISQPRVSFELEVDAQEPNPWDLTGSTVSYTGGKVGIGTAAPTDQLHVKNAAAGGIAGVFETPATGKILSGKVGATEKFSVDGGGNVYASGKVGIGITPTATELEVNGTIKTDGLILTGGGGSGDVLTNNGSGVATWQPAGGAAGTISGNGVDNTIPMFVAPGALGNSLIFQNGGNIGIDTQTPEATLEVNGTVQLGGNGVYVDAAGKVGIGTASPQTKLDVSGDLHASGNVGIGTSTPRDTLDIGGRNSPLSSFGLGYGMMKSQITSVSANTPTAIYSSDPGELIGALYIFVGGGGNSAMFEYRLITNSNGADGITSKLTLVDSLSRGSAPYGDFWLSNLGPHGAVNVNMTSVAATTVRAVFVGLAGH